MVMNDDDETAVQQQLQQALLQATEELKAEEKRMEAFRAAVVKAQGDKPFWWQADVDQLGPEELPDFAEALRRLRDKLHCRIHDLDLLLASTTTTTPPPPSPSQPEQH